MDEMLIRSNPLVVANVSDHQVSSGANSAPAGLRELVWPIRVLLVEDSLVLSERIAEILRGFGDVELVSVVDSEKKAIASIWRRRVDIVILDLHLKEGSGFGVLRAIRALHVKPRVIVLTNYDLPEYKQEALALGAMLFLDKAREFARLPDVLRELATPGN